MILIVALYLTIVSPPTDAEIHALRGTAPLYLTAQSAAWHLITARAAAVVHHVRPELLLAIAHHESRYVANTRTREPGQRESCGVMTPVPKQHCSESDLLMLSGYNAGAAHLRLWLDHCNGRETCALLSYAGGGGLVRACAAGRWPTNHGTDACDLADDFRRDAARIALALWAAGHPHDKRLSQ